MTINLNPYNDSKRIDYQDGDVSLERNPFSQTQLKGSKVHTVLPGETIQGIAFKYYGDSGLWGIIADTNSIYDPFEEIQDGVELIIPVYGG